MVLLCNLNSGDWIENLTSLEYANGEWTLYKFDEAEMEKMKLYKEEEEPTTSELYDDLVYEFNLMKLQ